VASGREDEALAACPRVHLGRCTPGEDVLAYERAADGTFRLTEGGAAGELQWPVVFVDWRSALRYSAWLSEQSGKPWRLLSELEWEKAARGVDGRLMPWGDHVEPTWACIVGSQRGVPGRVPVDQYPTDVSPYGVRGTVGNVRDWCANVWRHEGPVVEHDIVQPDLADPEDPALRALRGGAWSSAPSLCRIAGRFATSPADRFGALGFRLARAITGGSV
jgi:serine/threonine-protein kinase